MSGEPMQIAARQLRSAKHDLDTARRVLREQRAEHQAAYERAAATENMLPVLERRVRDAEQRLLRLARGDA